MIQCILQPYDDSDFVQALSGHNFLIEVANPIQLPELVDPGIFKDGM